MYIVIHKENKIKNIITASNIQNTIETLKTKNIITNEDEYKTFENIANMNVSDIRALREDGSVMSLDEQIKKKIVVLEKDEEVRDGVIVKLNKNVEEDRIKLIELGIEKLEDDRKIQTNEDGSKYITEKTMEEKLKDKLITNEEYNEYIIRIRQGQYQSQTDGAVIEVMRNFLNENKDNLSAEDKQRLEDVNKQILNIKETNKKIK